MNISDYIWSGRRSKFCFRKATVLLLALSSASGFGQTHRFDQRHWGDVTGATRTITETSLVPVYVDGAAKVLDLKSGGLRSVAGVSAAAKVSALSNNGTVAGKDGDHFFGVTPGGQVQTLQFNGAASTIQINAVTDRMEFAGTATQGTWGFGGPAYQSGVQAPFVSLQPGLYGGWFETHGASATDLRQELNADSTTTVVGIGDTNAIDGYRNYSFKRNVSSAVGGVGQNVSTILTPPSPGSSGFEMSWAKVNSSGDILIGFRDSYAVSDNRSWYSKLFKQDGSVFDLPFVGTGMNDTGQIVGWDSTTLDYMLFENGISSKLADLVADPQSLEFRRKNQDIGLLDISNDGWIVGQSQLIGSNPNAQAYWFATRVSAVPEPSILVGLTFGTGLLRLRRRYRFNRSSQGLKAGTSLGRATWRDRLL